MIYVMNEGNTFHLFYPILRFNCHCQGDPWKKISAYSSVFTYYFRSPVWWFVIICASENWIVLVYTSNKLLVNAYFRQEQALLSELNARRTPSNLCHYLGCTLLVKELAMRVA